MALLSEVAGRLLRSPAPATRELAVQRDLPVPMDDGVVLAGRPLQRARSGAGRDRARALARRPQRRVRVPIRAHDRPSRPPRRGAGRARDPRLRRPDRHIQRARRRPRHPPLAARPALARQWGRSGRATWGSCSGRSPTSSMRWRVPSPRPSSARWRWVEAASRSTPRCRGRSCSTSRSGAGLAAARPWAAAHAAAPVRGGPAGGGT